MLDFVWKVVIDCVKVFFICFLFFMEDLVSLFMVMFVLILFDGVVEYVGKDGLFGCLSNCWYFGFGLLVFMYIYFECFKII